MAASDIRVKVEGFDNRYQSSLSESLKLVKTYGESTTVTFSPSNIRITVWPESHIIDLQKIYQLEYELLNAKKEWKK